MQVHSLALGYQCQLAMMHSLGADVGRIHRLERDILFRSDDMSANNMYPAHGRQHMGRPCGVLEESDRVCGTNRLSVFIFTDTVEA